MNSKNLSVNKHTLEKVAADFGTPVYVYDEQGIRKTAQGLMQAFAWNKGYKNFFAVKATPTPEILRILHEEGMGFDCSSRAELVMVNRLGVKGSDIFFTSNNTAREDFELAIELGAIVNIDDMTQVPVFIDALKGRPYNAVSLRYNPGSAQTGNDIIGKPLEAKYGMSLEQLAEGYRLLATCAIKKFGLHTMVASNERDASYFGVTARLLREARSFVQKESKVTIDFINIGGGFGVAYEPDQKELDIDSVASAIKAELAGINVDILSESGRYVLAPHGYLVTRVRYVMEKYKAYLGVDASMHNLMRPGMYGAYHHITLLGASSKGRTKVYDVVGSLCENNDKFAIDRQLPKATVGDLLVIHDVGAHGHSMGFNYNGLLRSAEVLVAADGTTRLIRRAETLDDYFATAIW